MQDTAVIGKHEAKFMNTLTKSDLDYETRASVTYAIDLSAVIDISNSSSHENIIDEVPEDEKNQNDTITLTTSESFSLPNLETLLKETVAVKVTTTPGEPCYILRRWLWFKWEMKINPGHTYFSKYYCGLYHCNTRGDLQLIGCQLLNNKWSYFDVDPIKRQDGVRKCMKLKCLDKSKI